MKLYDIIHGLCKDYAIPLTDATIGYLQFFKEFNLPNSTDIQTVSCFVVDAQTGVQTATNPLNVICQYLQNQDFRLLIQGFNNLPHHFNFRFKIVVTAPAGQGGTSKTFFSDLYRYETCENSYAIIPCLIDEQEYSINENFINEIVGNIVYQSWHTTAEKKYTPVVFLRNVSFNRKSNTIEFKKLNNKPLTTKLKRLHSLRCEPVPITYTDDIDEVFAFGKVNILNKTYSFDSYNLETLDEKDDCPIYKINATAYIESNLRLLCSNNCVILNPIDCNDLTYPLNTDLPITICQADAVAGHTIDITQQVVNITGNDASQLNIFNGITNNCYSLVYANNTLSMVFNGATTNCTDQIIPFTLCNINYSFTIKLTIDPCCFLSVLNNVVYDNVAGGYNITGQILTAVYLEYSFNGTTWTRITGIFPIGNSIFTNAVTNTKVYFRVIAVCDQNVISNIVLACPMSVSGGVHLAGNSPIETGNIVNTGTGTLPLVLSTNFGGCTTALTATINITGIGTFSTSTSGNSGNVTISIPPGTYAYTFSHSGTPNATCANSYLKSC